MRRLKAILPLLLLLCAGGVLLASGTLNALHPQHLFSEQAALKSSIAEQPWLMRIAFVGIFTLAVATGIPGTILLVLTGGLLFGLVWGTTLAAAGLMLGSLLLFLASCYAFRSGNRAPPKLVGKLRHGFLAYPLSYTLFLRLVPVFPFGAITVALAWLRCPLWIFLGATMFGGTVMLVFETAIGAGLAEHLTAGGKLDTGVLLQPAILWPLCGMGLLALVPILLGHLHRSRLPGANGNGQQP